MATEVRAMGLRCLRQGVLGDLGTVMMVDTVVLYNGIRKMLQKSVNTGASCSTQWRSTAGAS